MVSKRFHIAAGMEVGYVKNTVAKFPLCMKLLMGLFSYEIVFYAVWTFKCPMTLMSVLQVGQLRNLYYERGVGLICEATSFRPPNRFTVELRFQ